MNKIEMGKLYRTRSGAEARIYAVDGAEEFCVHGAIKSPHGQWLAMQWKADGSSIKCMQKDPHDLVEYKPRVKLDVWVNLYPFNGSPKKYFCGYPTKAMADEQSSRDRIACINLKVDCEEGEGL